MHSFNVQSFYFLFLIHNLKWWFQFKTNSNLLPKICYENIVDVKKIKYQTKTYQN